MVGELEWRRRGEDRIGKERVGIMLYKTFSRFDLASRRILIAALCGSQRGVQPTLGPDTECSESQIQPQLGVGGGGRVAGSDTVVPHPPCII